MCFKRENMTIPTRTVPGLLLCLVIGLTGCTHVEPWERGNLAKPQMALEPDPMQNALRNHVYNSREAAAGSNAGQGGGCGCY